MNIFLIKSQSKRIFFFHYYLNNIYIFFFCLTIYIFFNSGIVANSLNNLVKFEILFIYLLTYPINKFQEDWSYFQ